jgi:hypothetical protein
MKKRDLTNVAASVHQRLLNLARETGRPFNELLQYYAMERFLFRLGNSPNAERFVLKNALMLRVWQLLLARPTMDIDMLGRTANTIENLIRVIHECLTLEAPEDGVQFDAASIKGEAITLEKKYQGVRIRLRRKLGNARLSLQLDFGFGDVITPGPVWIDFPQLLDFGQQHLLGYPKETVIAEKFQAMVELEMANTRLKDFYDLWQLARSDSFTGATLQQALAATFKQRNTPLPTAPPLALTAVFAEDALKQAQWKAFLRKGRLSDQDISLSTVVQEIGAFLLPVAAAAAEDTTFTQTWLPERRWQVTSSSKDFIR